MQNIMLCFMIVLLFIEKHKNEDSSKVTNFIYITTFTGPKKCVLYNSKKHKNKKKVK